jgi:four helix bundle protein
MTPQELEDRLIAFAVSIVQLTEKMSNSYASKYYANQLLRSGGSPALNYGEARSAESPKDFVHKVNVIIKELRESFYLSQGYRKGQSSLRNRSCSISKIRMQRTDFNLRGKCKHGKKETTEIRFD